MQPSREADHSPPSSAEVKNSEVIKSNPLNVFMFSAYLINNSANSAFLPLLFPHWIDARPRACVCVWASELVRNC
jgi:hypothetical protein